MLRVRFGWWKGNSLRVAGSITECKLQLEGDLFLGGLISQHLLLLRRCAADLHMQ